MSSGEFNIQRDSVRYPSYYFSKESQLLRKHDKSILLGECGQKKLLTKVITSYKIKRRVITRYNKL